MRVIPGTTLVAPTDKTNRWPMRNRGKPCISRPVKTLKRDNPSSLCLTAFSVLLPSMPTCAHTVENHFGNSSSRVLITAGIRESRRARDGTAQPKTLTTVCEIHFVTCPRRTAPTVLPQTGDARLPILAAMTQVRRVRLPRHLDAARMVAHANCRRGCPPQEPATKGAPPRPERWLSGWHAL